MVDLNARALIFALKRVVEELDYDLYKSIEFPEDIDEDESWEDVAAIFLMSYDEGIDFVEGENS